MKRKRKGFTLTELIAVIVVLALLLLIGIPAYNTIRKNTLQKQYDNVVMLIETTAEKFAATNSTNLTNVQELIDNGLLETDDGSKLLDPRDKSEMNCFLIEITYEKGTYVSKLTNKKQCDLEQAKRDYGTVNIVIKGLVTGKEDYASNEWINEDVELRVDRTNMSDDEVIKSYRWVSGSGQSSNLATMTTNVYTILKAMVTVEVTTTTDKKYWASTTLKIDKENPIIKDVEVSGGNDWTKGREVKINATDQGGSGIAGYYLGTTPCNDSSTYVTNGNITIEGKYILNETDYYVCVKDKVGNTTAYDKVLPLSIKDEVAPTCNWVGESTDWQKTKRVIELKCEDNESGCDPNYSGAKFEYDRTIKTATIEQKIKDIAGNEILCKKEVDVYVDKIAPSIPTSDIKMTNSSGTVLGNDVTSNSEKWYTYNVWWGSYSATDTGGSTIDHYEYSSNCTQNKTNNLSTNGYTYGNGTNYKFCIRAVDKAGNASNWSSPYFFKVDTVAPSVPTITMRKWTDNSDKPTSEDYKSKTNAGYTNNTWSNKKIFTIASSSDNESGIAYYMHTATGATTAVTDNKGSYRNVQADGESWIKYKACDNAGNCSAYSSNNTIKVDKTAPSCSITASGTVGKNSWYTSDVDLTLSVSDTGGSAVNSKGLTTSSAASYNGKTTASSSFTKGTTYYGYVKDNAGNTGNCTKTIKVDKSAPSLSSVTISGSANDVYRNVKIVVTESYSGVAATKDAVKVRYRHGCCSEAKLEDYVYADSNPELLETNQFKYGFKNSGVKTNVLYMRITLTDKAGNSSNLYKYRCYYSNNKCESFE